MRNLEIGQEVFYIHAPYDELPVVRKGVVRETPPLLEHADDRGAWICPFEHKDHAGTISHKWVASHLVFLSELEAYPTLSAVIDGRVDRKHKEIRDLRNHDREVLLKLLADSRGEELKEDEGGIRDQDS